MTHTEKTGALYIVATPIGNPRDITLRALDILKQVDAIICEDLRQGSRLLRQLGVENELLTLNEHNEAEESEFIVLRPAQANPCHHFRCWHPLFCRPGRHLDLCYWQASRFHRSRVSFDGCLSLSNFPIDRFISQVPTVKASIAVSLPDINPTVP